MYEEMRTKGFRPASLRRRIRTAYVHLGREGEVIWGTGGNHRLAIARILGLESIPVRVHLQENLLHSPITSP